MQCQDSIKNIGAYPPGTLPLGLFRKNAVGFLPTKREQVLDNVSFL